MQFGGAYTLIIVFTLEKQYILQKHGDFSQTRQIRYVRVVN